MAEAPRTRALDRIDRQILRELQADGRIANVDLARRVNLSPPPCLERVKRLEREGFISRYVAILNPQKLEAALVAYIQVTLHDTATPALERFNRAVAAFEEVQECHMVAGGFDYMLKIRVADMQSYRDFLGEKLAALPGLRETHTYVVMQEIKSTNAISV